MTSAQQGVFYVASLWIRDLDGGDALGMCDGE